MPRSVHHIAPQNAAIALIAACVLVSAIALLRPHAPAESPAPLSKYSFPSGQSIQLIVPPAKLAKLQARRDAALAVGILQDDDSSWVKAKLVEANDTFPIKLRLKGDWTDHLEGAKWSFRIALQDSAAWRRMTVFSLHSPDRRGFLHEWLFHQVLAGEGLLTTRYDFIDLHLNGQHLGRYAIEEHFTKQLLESQQRREGPLLKLDETGMWDARIASLRDPAFPYLQIPFFQAATVQPFKPKTLLQDSLLRVQFGDAQRLMLQYRADIGQPGQVFDLAQTAKQYALIDLFGAYHSLIWHNRRYYFNPITQLLEPVVFDGFDGPQQGTYIAQPFWGYRLSGHTRDDADYRDVTSVYVFQDPDFVRAYYRALLRYTAPAYMDSVVQALAPARAAKTAFLRAEYWGYRLDISAITARAAEIRRILCDSISLAHMGIVETAARNGSRRVEVWNRHPVAVEVFAGRAAPQYLEADAGQAAQKTAVFWLEQGETLQVRLAGSALE